MNVNSLLELYNKRTQSPESFLSSQEESHETFRELTKNVYDFAKKRSLTASNTARDYVVVKKALPVLHIEQFDVEQIWQEIELENIPFLKNVLKSISKIAAKQESLNCGLTSNEVVAPVIKKVQFASENEVEEEEEEEDIEPIPKKAKTKNDPEVETETRRAIKESIVDDKFFKLSELEDFLNLEDKKEQKDRDGVDEGSDDEEDEVNLFEALPSEDDESDGENEDLGGRKAMFTDFFDLPRGEAAVNNDEEESKSSDDDESNEDGFDTRDYDPEDVEEDPTSTIGNLFEAHESEDSDGESVEGILGESADRAKHVSWKDKSDFEKQQTLLEKKIHSLEKETLIDKPWQLAGESTADRRPENSLLAETLQFDHVSREAPLITEETTFKLEDLLKQRIKNSSWDDVVRKAKPSEQAFEFRRRVTLEQEKSKASLAEVYEKEYLKQTQDDVPEEENVAHTEIRTMARTLFLQLDALSNFNFTPRPPEPEVKIINNLPAISAEEVLPTAASDATLLAPEEVVAKPKRDVKSKSERTETDKKRERRSKKKMQGDKRKFQEAKERRALQNPALGNKYAKLAKDKVVTATKNMDEDQKRKEIERLTKTSFKSSKSFFAKLQDEVHNAKGGKLPVKADKQMSSKSLKL